MGSKLRFGCAFLTLFGFAGAFRGLTHPDPISSSELEIEDFVFFVYLSSSYLKLYVLSLVCFALKKTFFKTVFDFFEMLTEFALLTALTLTDDEREALRDKVSEWVRGFLPKLKRESSRTEKCRLVASVERHEFRGDLIGTFNWRFCKFVGDKGFIFNAEERELEEFTATLFQEKILGQDPSLSGVLVARSEITEEIGEWKFER